MRRPNNRATEHLRGDDTPKTRYATLREALAEVKRLERQSRDGVRRNAYPCEVCGGFHVGRAQARRHRGGGWK